jgi:hypothetical protein
MDFFAYSLTLEGSSGCVVALNQLIKGAEMFDDSGQITATKRVSTRAQCYRTAALFCHFRRLTARRTGEFHSIEKELAPRRRLTAEWITH